SGTIRRPRLRSTKNSGGGSDRRGKGGLHVLEWDAVVLGHKPLVFARLDAAGHVSQPGAAMDEDWLTERSGGIREQQRFFGDRKRKPHRPAVVVLDALQVLIDHLMKDPLTRPHHRE